MCLLYDCGIITLQVLARMPTQLNALMIACMSSLMIVLPQLIIFPELLRYGATISSAGNRIATVVV